MQRLDVRMRDKSGTRKASHATGVMGIDSGQDVYYHFATGQDWLPRNNEEFLLLRGFIIFRTTPDLQT